MVGTNSFPKSRVGWITVFVTGLIIMLILGTACSSGDKETSAAASDKVSVASDPTQLESEGIVDDDLYDADLVEPSTIDDRIASAQAVVPRIVPDPGSDEEAILEVLDRVARAIRAENTSEYVEACNPTRPRLTEAQTKFVFESVFASFGELAGITHRDVTVRTFKDNTAITESVMYDYDNVLMSRFQYSFTKVDGNWYADTNCK